jgi:subtilisin family serine protease
MGEFRAPWTRLLGLGAITAATLAMVTVPASAQGRILDAGGPNAVEGSYLVVLKDGVRADSLIARTGIDVTHRYSSALNGFAAHMGERAALRLAADPTVAYVAQDQVVRAFVDQLNPPSWGLDRVDQPDRPLNNKYSYATTASNVHAYIIDSGIRTTHTDFGGRASFDRNTIDAINTDCNGHGTHVAGTVGGTTNGIAKGVRLHAVKVLGCNNSGTIASVVAGVDWVTANKIKPAVANMSLGAPGNPTLDAAVNNSIASGITYVAASGNSAPTPACAHSPARAPEVITVAATNVNDNLYTSSSNGTCVDLFAPGEGITSAWFSDNTSSAVLTGTSMAAPHVTGAAALFLGANPNATPRQVSNVMTNNATPNKIPGLPTESPNILLHSRADLPARPGSDRLLRGETLNAGQSKVSRDARYALAMQLDGNLVLYGPSGHVWDAGTQGTGAAYVTLQTDGNLVVYTASDTAVFQTGTYGTAADRLIVQTDSNLALYGAAGQVFWNVLFPGHLTAGS